MVVVKAPSVTRRNTHTAEKAEKTAREGLWP
jgi:hypothetical protein